MIHTAGDSHGFYAFVGIGTWHTAGNLLMYWAGFPDRLQHIANDIALVPGDVLVFSCGEIDVRFCIRKQTVKQGVDYHTVIERLVAAYLDRVVEVDAHGATKAVLGVSPPAPGKFGEPHDPDVTDGQRVAYTLTLNAILREGCSLRGLPFIDLYPEVVGPDGLLPLELSDGWTHFVDATVTRRVLKRLGLIAGEVTTP